MSPRRYISIFLLCGLPMFTGCAAHYQDLLRDRDAEIRELQGRLANARSEVSDLGRREQAALAKLAEKPAARPVEASSRGSAIDQIQAELGDDAEVRYSNGRLSIGIDNTVTFTSGSTAVKSSANGVLRRVAKLLQRDFPGRRIYIEGHTDTDPIKRTKKRFRSNRHLSLERADAVASYMIKSCGVDHTAVAVVGYGQFAPRIPGSSQSAKARNRRVEIVVGEPL